MSERSIEITRRKKEDHNFRESQEAWHRHYIGVIPSTWRDVSAITADIARMTANTSMDSTLVEPVLTHPSLLPVFALVGAQRLTPEQMAIIIARPDCTLNLQDSASVKQRLLGVPHSLWVQAKHIASEMGADLIPHFRPEPSTFRSSI